MKQRKGRHSTADQVEGNLEAAAAGSSYHVPVLFAESLDALRIRPDGRYVDCTMGGGGHTRGILERLGPDGRLIAFDQDADARKNLPDDPRIVFVPENFRHIHRFLRLYELLPIDGLLADLGVSSHQFDEGSRGFSYRFDAALDMRMNQEGQETAASLLNTIAAAPLQQLLSSYGEVTNARTLSQALVEARRITPFATISDLLHVLKPMAKGNPHRYYAQVFQALRIAVNDEMGALGALLEQLPLVLKPGGVAAIITFHSLEDRMVKQFFKTGSIGPQETAEGMDAMYGQVRDSPFEVITKKPIEASAEELQRNDRSRSARLRVAMMK